MTTTPMRRLAAGATTALLAGALLVPAAIAVADEAPLEDQTTTALGAPVGEADAPAPAPETAPESEAEPAPAEAVAEAAVAPVEEPAPAPAAVAAASAPAGATTAASTDTAGLTDAVALAPGEQRTVAVEVVDAVRFTFIVLGEDVTGSIRTPGGTSYPAYAFGGYSSTFTGPGAAQSGTVTITVRNDGAASRVVPYGFAYERQGSPLSIFAGGTGSPDLGVFANTGIAGLTGQARLIAGDGTASTTAMTPLVTGSSTYRAEFADRTPGYYLAEVSFTIAGVVHERIMVARAAALETTPPAVEYLTDPAASNASGWFRRAVTVTLQASDAGAGVWRIFRGLDTTTLEAAYGNTTTVPVATEGVHILRYYAEDLQSNVSGTVERTIRIDLTNPAVSLDGVDAGQEIEQDAEVVVDYACTDALSGVASCTGSIASGGLLDTSAPGVHEFTVVAVDRAGNETRETRSYRVPGTDTTAPELDVDAPEEPASGWHIRPVTLAFAATDDDSGVALIHWEYATGSGVVVGSSEGGSAELTLDRTGVYEVEVWAEDVAGNRTETRTATVRVDLDAPTIAVTAPDDARPTILPNGHYAQHERVEVDFACDDEGAGVATCDATTPDGELLPTGIAGAHELRIVATDAAGNRTERVVSYTVDAAPASGGPGSTPAASRDPRLAQTGVETVIPGIVLVAVLLAAGATLLATRRLGGR